MEQQTNYIVFLCYGNEGVFYECSYALLSLSRLYRATGLSNTEIWIYTDKPEWFRSFKDCPLPLHYREVDKATIQQWRGQIDFVHRVKVEILKDLTKDKKGNILYVDTDTVFMYPIDEMLQGISTGKLYMHTREGKVSDCGSPVLRKLDKYLRTGQALTIKDKPLYEMAMWNAGVLGFNTKYKHLLDEVLAYTDSEYPKFAKHVVEQFAFSVYFQVEGNVKAAAPYIFHYWKLKEARIVLASFFEHFKNTSWEQLTQYSTLIQMPALMQEKVDFLHNRGIMDSIMKKQWTPGKVDWEEVEREV